jgi:hypothetical protein
LFRRFAWYIQSFDKFILGGSDRLLKHDPELLEQMDNSRIKTMMEQTERLAMVNQIRDYIAVITEEGRCRLGESYPESNFAKWVDWADQFLEKNDCWSWKLPKFDLSDQYFFIL